MVGREVQGTEQPKAIGGVIADELIDFGQKCRAGLGRVAAEVQLVVPEAGNKIGAAKRWMNKFGQHFDCFGKIDRTLDSVGFEDAGIGLRFEHDAAFRTVAMRIAKRNFEISALVGIGLFGPALLDPINYVKRNPLQQLKVGLPEAVVAARKGNDFGVTLWVSVLKNDVRDERFWLFDGGASPRLGIKNVQFVGMRRRVLRASHGACGIGKRDE